MGGRVGNILRSCSFIANNINNSRKFYEVNVSIIVTDLTGLASMVHPLESILMRNYKMNYAEAADIVAKARSRSGLSTNLKPECHMMVGPASSEDLEKVLNSVKQKTRQESTDVTEELTETEETERGSIEESGITQAERSTRNDYHELSLEEKWEMVRLQLLANLAVTTKHFPETTPMKRHGVTHAEANIDASKAPERLYLPKSDRSTEVIEPRCNMTKESEDAPVSFDSQRLGWQPVKKDLNPQKIVPRVYRRRAHKLDHNLARIVHFQLLLRWKP